MCFLGYSNLHKGFKCLDISTGRIYISRDVTFDGSLYPFAQLNPIRAEILLLLPSLLHPGNEHVATDPVLTKASLNPADTVSADATEACMQCPTPSSDPLGARLQQHSASGSLPIGCMESQLRLAAWTCSCRPPLRRVRLALLFPRLWPRSRKLSRLWARCLLLRPHVRPRHRPRALLRPHSSRLRRLPHAACLRQYLTLQRALAARGHPWTMGRQRLGPLSFQSTVGLVHVFPTGSENPRSTQMSLFTMVI